MEKSDFIFGLRPVIEAIKSGKNIDKLLLKKGLRGDSFHELNELVKLHRINARSVPEEKLNHVTRKNHQGVIAFISPVPFYDLEEIITQVYEKGETPFFLYLDQITDVRNFGAIVRTAECAGVHAVIIPESRTAQIGSDAIKTSSGALHIVPVCKVKDPLIALNILKENGIKLIAATEKATSLYAEADFSVPCSLIMGSEDKGISEEILIIANELVKIPLHGQIESLNVSVAAGIILFEGVKQRHAK
ncbi:MAG: 23S rRNA (guanosine(2251)-2'-O)-methyltransferase RlmB [Prolixibacteraceae bacterium]|nr:23S rRNA (guanosine(2251)-2'-O)-methyltransferase RlmB [Prolixibacteraceae bacterium]